MKTSTKSRIRKGNAAAPQTYGIKYAEKLQNAADHIDGQESGERCTACSACRNVVIPFDIYTASVVHRQGVIRALRGLANQIFSAPGQSIQIGLCEAPKGLTVEVARDVLYIMRAVGA